VGFWVNAITSTCYGIQNQKHALALTAFPRGVRLAVFTSNPFAAIYFLPTAAKSKHKFFWKKFEHHQDGPFYEGNALHPLIYSFL
tara:strand:+ start:63377 stop:63631 length:255 start_codon:yes stop_codon:yes gene_type:complete